MKALIVGGTGLIGKAVSKELKKVGYEVISASLNNSDIHVDLSSHDSIEKMFEQVSNLDAVVSCPAGVSHKMERITNLQIDDYKKAIQVKGFGQMDLVLTGLKYLNPNGSFTLTSGILSEGKLPKVSCISTTNSALEGFAKNASLELPNGLRLNIVSPNVIAEALGRHGKTFVGYEGVSLQSVVYAYIRSVAGIINGEILKVW